MIGLGHNKGNTFVNGQSAHKMQSIFVRKGKSSPAGELFGVLGEKLLLLDHGDAALAVGVGIIFAYHATQYIHDVIDEHLVVDHDGPGTWPCRHRRI